MNLFWLRGDILKNNKILIIGGAGYIGSVLTDYLLEKDYQVRSFDLFIYNHNQTILPYFHKPGYEFFYGDHTDSKAVEKVLEGISHVILLAGLVGDPITTKYPKESEKINHDGMLNLIDLLNGKGLERVIFVSTCSNYGLIENDSLADENHELKPLSLYAKAKVAIEKYLLSLKDKVDYSPTILRFATAFGLSTRMRFDLTVSEFARELFMGKELLVYDANTWRPYCHVQDFAIVINKVLEASLDKVAFEVFNAGGEINNYTKQMIVDSIISFLPDAKIKYKEHGTDPRNYRVAFNKIQEILSFEPKFTINDGIKELINALKQHLFDNVEQNKNFYGNYSIDYNVSIT